MEGSVAEGQKDTTPPDAVPETASRDPEAPMSVRDSIAKARERLEQGGSILDLEDAEPAPSPEPTEEETADLEAEALEAELEDELEAPEPGEEAEPVPADDRWHLEGDPEGTYRDHQGRLHDAEHHGFVSDSRFAEARMEIARRRDEDAEAELEEEELEAGAEEEEDAGEGEVEGLTVTLPGRDPGDEFEIVAEDEETAERLRQLKNGFQRGEEHRRQMESLNRDRQEFEEVSEAFLADPAAFLASNVRDDIRKDVVLHLLSDDELLEEVQPKLREWEVNPDRREADVAELRLKSRERRDEASTRRSIEDRMQDTVTRMRETIQGWLPADLPASEAQKLQTLAMKTVGEEMLAARKFDVTEDDMRKVLDHYGLSRMFEFSGSSGGNGQPGGSDPSPSSARRVKPVSGDSEEAEKARRKGDEFKESSAKRRAAAAAPPGAGATAASAPEPPEGQSVKERIEWVRKHGGIGNVLAGKT